MGGGGVAVHVERAMPPPPPPPPPPNYILPFCPPWPKYIYIYMHIYICSEIDSGGILKGKSTQPGSVLFGLCKKGGGGGGGGGISYSFVCTIFLINALYIELLSKRNIFREGGERGKLGFWGGGG